MASTAKPISRAPTSAAWNGAMPSSTWRWMFSSMTMASSTTRPIASTIARRVSVLIEKPKAYISANAPTRLTGMVTSGISVARNERRKKKITRTTSTTASAMVVKTALIDSRMKIELS